MYRSVHCIQSENEQPEIKAQNLRHRKEYYTLAIKFSCAIGVTISKGLYTRAEYLCHI